MLIHWCLSLFGKMSTYMMDDTVFGLYDNKYQHNQCKMILHFCKSYTISMTYIKPQKLDCIFESSSQQTQTKIVVLTSKKLQSLKLNLWMCMAKVLNHFLSTICQTMVRCRLPRMQPNSILDKKWPPLGQMF